jgi:hypothetical protein
MANTLTFISRRKAKLQKEFARGTYHNDMLDGDVLPNLYPSHTAAKFNEKIDELFKCKGKYFRLSRFTKDAIGSLYEWVSELRTEHERARNKVYADKLVEFIQYTVGNGLVWTRVASTSLQNVEEMTYDANMPKTHTIITNGIISHNSDVRLYTRPRVMNAAPGNSSIGKGMIEEEKGINGGTDTYRYIHIRAHKNKLSVPNLEGWLRLWITDSKNQARGLDPVWDTYRYLMDTGQAKGKRNALKLTIKGHESSTAMKWVQFKTLILGTKKQIREMCETVGVKTFDLRAFCKNQLANGDGLTRYFEQKNVDTDAEDKDEAIVPGDDEE